jgi:hypothetical protein
MSDPDDRLRERLQSKLEQKADGGDDGSGSTAQEGDYGDDDDEEEDDTEMEMSEEMQKAVQMIAEASGDDVSPEQVEEMLQPLLGEDARDDDAEMAANTDTESEADGDGGGDADIDREALVAEATEAAEEVVAEALPDSGLVTEDDLDAKLDDVVDALADETKDVLQKANVGATPTPTATGDSTVTKDDLFSNSGADADGGSE